MVQKCLLLLTLTIKLASSTDNLCSKCDLQLEYCDDFAGSCRPCQELCLNSEAEECALKCANYVKLLVRNEVQGTKNLIPAADKDDIKTLEVNSTTEHHQNLILFFQIMLAAILAISLVLSLMILLLICIKLKRKRKKMSSVDHSIQMNYLRSLPSHQTMETQVIERSQMLT